MVELGNMKIITSAIAMALMWHVQFYVFSLFKTVLQSQCPALCISLYLLDKQESKSCHLYTRMFSVHSRLMERGHFKSCGLLNISGLC